MKVLRVSMGYPTEDLPGSGLNCYYHSLYSKNETCIVTTKKNSPVIPLDRYVRYEEILTKKKIISKDENNKFTVLIEIIGKALNQLLFFYRSMQILNEYQPDLVHVYSPIPIKFGRYCRKHFNSIYVMSLHGSDVVRIKNNRYLVRLLNDTDAILTIADNTKDMLMRLGVRVPILHMGNGVDLSVFKNTHKKRKEQFVQVGSFRWQKGKEYLIEAFANFSQYHSEYSLVLIGDGEDFEKIKKLCNDLQITNKVIFTGNISQKQIVEYLNESKAFILSSISEGFPKAIYEAMATGTPVVSTNLEGFTEVIKDSGILVEPKRVDQLVAAMEDIVDENKWEERSKLSEKYAMEHSWPYVVDNLDNIYDDLFQKRGKVQ